MNKIKKIISDLWIRNPVIIILVIAIIPRLLAIIFSKGYGMHDDHFGPIEQPFMILNDINVWLGRGAPHSHSIVYPSLHFILFKILNFFAVSDPQDKMFFVRTINALYSLFTVYFGFKITEIISDRKAAVKVGLLLSLFWPFPFLSVRDLIEMACLPPLMAAFYFLVKNENKRKYIFLSGIFFALSWIFRTQTILFAGTVFLILFFRKEYKLSLWFISGFLLPAFLIQGLVDIFAWGYPFAAFWAYILDNFKQRLNYTTGPFYNYFLLITGIFIPPLSFMLIYGFCRSWKKYYILFLPALVFFIFHSIFPNKQERFIIPMIPVFIILAVIGWNEFIESKNGRNTLKSVFRYSWFFFWIVNTVLLLLFSTSYSKKTRVETLHYLSKKDNVNGIVISGGRLGIIQPPLFYLNKYGTSIIGLKTDADIEKYKNAFDRNKRIPNYLILFDIKNADERKTILEQAWNVKMTFEKEFKPSLIDDVLYFLNPKGNLNQTAYIYNIKPSS